MSNLQSGRFRIGEITAQDGGKIENVTLGIKQSITVIQDCVFKTLQKSDITTKVAQDFGFSVTNDTKNTQKADSTATSTSTQKNMGLSLESLLYSIISSALVLVAISLVFILKFSLKKDAKDLMRSGKMTAEQANNFSNLGSVRGMITAKS